MLYASGWKWLGYGSCLVPLFDPGLRNSCYDWAALLTTEELTLPILGIASRETCGVLEREAGSSKAHKAFLHDKVRVGDSGSQLGSQHQFGTQTSPQRLEQAPALGR